MLCRGTDGQSGLRCALCLACLLVCGSALAQTQTRVGTPAAGHGSVSASLQYIAIEERSRVDGSGGVEDFGRIDLRSLYLELDYGLSDRLALSLWLPFKSNRYRGDFPHDPRLLLDARGERFLDDGEWHSSLADVGIGLRWLWREDPLAVTPFISFHWPSRDYPLFTETQAGTQQWRLDLGVNLGDRLGPAHWNTWWQAGVAYSLMEKTRPRDAPARRVNRSMLHLSIGKMLSPESGLSLTLTRRDTYNALDFPFDFRPPFNDDLFYHHDQLLPWEYTTASLAWGRSLGSDWQLDLSYGRTVSLRWGHKYKHALTMGLTRSF